jgi:branched-chain amino acid transport system substrate-binding protein
MSRKSIIVLLIVVIAILSCAKTEKQSKVTIGAILPLTGDIASYGKNAQSGIDLAAEEINQSGGIDGKKLEVIYEDDKGLANEAVKIAQKMATIDKVPVIMGSAASSVTLAMCPIANQNKVVLISPISSSKELTTEGGEYFFRVCPSDAFQSVILADWIWKAGHKSIGIIYVNNSWGIGLKDEFVKSFEQVGGRVVTIEASLGGDKDFKTQISKIMSKKPDALFAPTYGIEGGILLKQAKELGVKIPIYGADVWSSPELLTSAGDAAEGVSLTLPAKPGGEKYDAFASKYRLKYGKEPDVYSAYSYDMLEIIANGLKEGNRTGEQLQRYLRTMPAYEGVTGTTKFDEHGDVISKSFSKQRIVGGKYVEVE